MVIHRIGLHETDAAGVLFTGSAITLAHDAYERALAHAGCDIADMIRAGRWALPIRHASADFQAPLLHGQDVAIAVTLRERRDRSFQVRVVLADAATNARAATIDLTPVAVDLASGTSADLPQEVTTALDRLSRTDDKELS